VDRGTVEYLAALETQPGIRVLRDDSPFNYSGLNNRAAAVARGEVLCLLNDDIEVLTPGWLDEMVSFAVQPDVGAVGARLWYPGGTLQHGGVIVGVCDGVAHAHRRLARGDPGYFGRAVVQQELSAVTGACLVVRAEAFAAVSGLDERLEVAFNDVDFCLKLRQAGYRNIWTPFAELVHHESASRGVTDTPAKRAREEREINILRERWGETLRRDPFYNPNLSHTAADFSIDAPRARSRRAA
jgi:GT2 family glycosyltransferase